MSELRSPSLSRPRIPTRGAFVKAQIVRAGLGMRELAEAAGIAPSTLSDYLSGRLASPETQYDIYLAFVRLTGSTDVGLEQFWGNLFWRELHG